MLIKNRAEFPLNSSRAIPDEEKNKVIFIFTLLCGASKRFHEGLSIQLSEIHGTLRVKVPNKSLTRNHCFYRSY